MSLKSRFLNSSVCYWLLYTLISTIQHLPVRFSLKIGSLIARVIPYIVPKDIRIATAQLKFARSKSQIPQTSRLSELDDNRQMRKFISDMFANIGETVVESLCTDALLAKSKSNTSSYQIICKEDPIVTKILEEKQSMIVLCSHLGCFELLAAYYAVYRNAGLTVMARKPNYAAIDKLIKSNRTSNHFQTLWREDKNSGSGLLRAIKNKQIIAALIDQDLNLENEFAPFFGHPAAYPVGLIKLAVRFSLPISSAFIIRTNNNAINSHTILVNQIHYDVKDENACKQILTVYSTRLEELIKQYPEQWVWWHKRWRREPDIDYINNPTFLKSGAEYIRWLEELS